MSLFCKYSWHMMNTSVAGILLLTTRKSWPTSISPSTLSLCHELGHFFLMRAEGCIIQKISEALDSCPRRRHKFRGIVFVNLCNFLHSAEYIVALTILSELCCFYEWNRAKVAQFYLLINNMMWKYQRLTQMFNMIYGCFWNQLIS